MRYAKRFKKANGRRNFNWFKIQISTDFKDALRFFSFWWCWRSTPGLCAYEVRTLPLSHIPSPCLEIWGRDLDTSLLQQDACRPTFNWHGHICVYWKIRAVYCQFWAQERLGSQHGVIAVCFGLARGGSLWKQRVLVDAPWPICPSPMWILRNRAYLAGIFMNTLLQAFPILAFSWSRL